MRLLAVDRADNNKYRRVFVMILQSAKNIEPGSFSILAR